MEPYWVIATDPYLSTPSNQVFRKGIHERTEKLTRALGEGGEPSTIQESVQKTLAFLYNNPDALFLVVQDIYMTETARDAHLILPAAWGEANETSINCNSRLLRLYEKFMDPPREAKPDWEIFKWVGLRIAELYRPEGKAQEAAKFEFGKNWRTDEDVFLAGTEEFADNRVSEEDKAKLEAENYKGVTYAFLKQLGQKGIQTPVRRDPRTGQLVGTVRPPLHLQVRHRGRQVQVVRHRRLGRLPAGGGHGPAPALRGGEPRGRQAPGPPVRGPGGGLQRGGERAPSWSTSRTP